MAGLRYFKVGRLAEFISSPYKRLIMNNKDKAKKIFFDYACRHFHMDRDGIGEVYKKFGISKAQEEIWRQEYISKGQFDTPY